MRGAYLIGEPGSGKSTLARALSACADHEYRAKPFAHAVYYDQESRIVAAQIGGDHARFPGTDRLSMSVQPRAIEWVLGAPYPVVWAEGDRLATAGFLEALAAACEEWWLIWLALPPEVAAERRAERGSGQNETWLAGRRTKVERLAQAYSDRLVTVDASQPAEVVAAEVRELPSFSWTKPVATG